MRKAFIVLMGAVVGVVVTAAPASSQVAPRCFGRDATITGTDEGEVLEGTPERDIIVAGGGNDTIRARAGYDRICAGPGDDVVYAGRGNDDQWGGPGNDTMHAQAGGGPGTFDLLIPGAGDDVLRGGPGEDVVSLATASNPVTIDLAAGTATGAGSDTLADIESAVGSAFDDVIAGNETANNLLGLGGSDRIEGRGGNDSRLWGDAAGPFSKPAGMTPGSDVISAGAGRDVLFGDRRNDMLRGGAGPDDILGAHGNDALEGGADRDRLSGGGGDNEIAGGEGIDTANWYRSAQLEITLTRGSGNATSAAGSDMLRGIENLDGSYRADMITVVGHATIWGDGGDDYVDAGTGDQRVFGGGGNDVLKGGSGNDRLVGRRGTDRVNGGSGTDSCSAERQLNCE